jgi:serine/threonine protein phosphatase PrpC
VRIRAVAATDIGLVRERNEDSYLVDEPLFAVADGMGGHRGGDVASRLAIETLASASSNEGDVALSERVRQANRAVFERSRSDRAVAGMGTTLTAALIDGDRARLAHIGDSRAYLFREGELRMLTEDHTLVQQMVREGEISETEAGRHPQRSVVTRALGIDPSVVVDESIVDLHPGDRVLICSDGLTNMIEDDAVRAILEAEPDTERAAAALVRAANDAGGVDNTTVVLIDVAEGEPEARGVRRDTAVGPTTATAAEARARPRPARARWPRRAAIAVAALVVVAAALVGVRAYLDSQWYVGVSGGHVAIFQGIPTEVAGFRLNHVEIQTTIPAAQAERLAVYRSLGDGITADGRTDAEQIVDQIRRDVAAASRPKKTGSSGGGS